MKDGLFHRVACLGIARLKEDYWPKIPGIANAKWSTLRLQLRSHTRIHH